MALNACYLTRAPELGWRRALRDGAKGAALPAEVHGRGVWKVWASLPRAAEGEALVPVAVMEVWTVAALRKAAEAELAALGVGKVMRWTARLRVSASRVMRPEERAGVI